MKTPRDPSSPKRPPRPRPEGDPSTVLYWIAALLVIVLLGIVAVYVETPEIRGWFTAATPAEPAEQTPAAKPAPLPRENPAPIVESPPPPRLPEPELTLKEQAAKATRELERKTAVAPPPSIPALPPPITTPPSIPPPAPAPGEPPLVQPAPHGVVSTVPARALPLDMGKLDTERIAAYQVALERLHFSCGFIDGDQGMRTQRMLRAFQLSRGLPVTGVLDPVTREAIGEPGEPFLNYTVSSEDIAAIMPKPQTWREKAKATRLGYNDIWELLAEKFHCTRGYLKMLNHEITTPVAGSELIGPKVIPAAPMPHAASLRIYLGETSLEALDASGRVIAFFPCSIAKDKNKRPHGQLKVKVVDPNPDYTFDPELFGDSAKAEGITHKMRLPPGPRNPVGTTWVGLNLPGYGIHGTPDPEAISRTQSHGCFRLANWNAQKVIKMVSVGTPVDIEP